MYNSVVDKAFKFSADDAARYGKTAFGASCLVAKQVLAANQGTRYVQITFGSWDMHQNIYSPAANSLAAMGKTLDDGVSALLADLKASGQLDETLVVMMGEFGRTVGKITAAGGRDHYPQQSVIFAGAGERIELSHKATSRQNFAAGALRAAHYVAARRAAGRPGLADMRDVLGMT
jgi:uncharacterized protein (DUF1501 family)